MDIFMFCNVLLLRLSMQRTASSIFPVCWIWANIKSSSLTETIYIHKVHLFHTLRCKTFYFYDFYARIVIGAVTDCAVCQPTFQVWRAHGRHGRGWGLAETLKRSLLARGVVWSPVLLFLLLFVWTHGLQSQLFPVQTYTHTHTHKYPGYYSLWSQISGQKQYEQHGEWCGSLFTPDTYS